MPFTVPLFFAEPVYWAFPLIVTVVEAFAELLNTMPTAPELMRLGWIQVSISTVGTTGLKTVTLSICVGRLPAETVCD